MEIQKLTIQKLTIAGKKYEYPDTTALVGKINELVDAVNELQATISKMENVEPADPYAEQRKWIGKACWFWDGNAQTKAFGQLNQIDPLDDGQNAPYQTNYGQWYEHCEPVLPNDPIIYKTKGDNNE